MDRQVIDNKLESLRRCLARLRDRRPATREDLANDLDAQDILALNLSRAVQLCVDIGAHCLADTAAAAPETMGQTFDLLAAQGIIDAPLATRMKKAVGFRNIAVHNYERMDWGIVHALASDNLGDFERFAECIVTRVLNK